MIRLSQWAEIRQMHVVDGVPKKQIAERLGLDIKTVRRAVAQAAAPARRAVSRPRHLDRWRAQIEQWLRQDRRLTAKRIRRLLLPLAGPVAERTVRWYVARLKAAAAPKEVYVHRSPRPGVTLEVDFGESWAEVAGVLRQVKYGVATLPYSNVYFAKAYPVERLESLLDGMQAAVAYRGGVTDRVVLDNTTIAVKQVLTGRDRVQTDAFQAFRGAYPFAAACCAPAKGWEKGSVETGVTYVRNLVFRPRPTVASWAARNALIITELEADVATPAARRRASGAGSVDAGAAAPAGPARSPPRDLPRRGAGGRQVRARPGGPGDPRHPSGHPGRLGRRDHDGRAPCTGRIVEANRVVGGVRGDARDVVVDGLDPLDARRRVIARRGRARVRDDHTGVINTHRECLPPARATASMFRSGPFTRAGNRQASAVDDEMKACAPWNGCLRRSLLIGRLHLRDLGRKPRVPPRYT